MIELAQPDSNLTWDDYSAIDGYWRDDMNSVVRIMGSRDYLTNGAVPTLAEHLAYPVPIERAIGLGVKVRSHYPDPRESTEGTSKVDVKSVFVGMRVIGKELENVYGLNANDTRFELHISEARCVFWITSEIHGGDPLIHGVKWLANKAKKQVPRAISGHVWHGWLNETSRLPRRPFYLDSNSATG